MLRTDQIVIPEIPCHITQRGDDRQQVLFNVRFSLLPIAVPTLEC
ncbi:MAG: hypothetical protein ACP5QA_03855 [Phycisphaerae bacterium]